MNTFFLLTYSIVSGRVIIERNREDSNFLECRDGMIENFD